MHRTWVLGLVIALSLGGCLGTTPNTSTNETISVSETIETGNDKYYPANDTVAFARTRGVDGLNYDTVSFEEYARWQCAVVANRRIGQLLRTQFDGSPDNVNTGTTTESVVVGYEGDAFFEPTYDQVATALPERVETTVRLFNQSQTCTIPVHLERSGEPEPL